MTKLIGGCVRGDHAYIWRRRGRVNAQQLGAVLITFWRRCMPIRYITPTVAKCRNSPSSAAMTIASCRSSSPSCGARVSWRRHQRGVRHAMPPWAQAASLEDNYLRLSAWRDLVAEMFITRDLL